MFIRIQHDSNDTRNEADNVDNDNTHKTPYTALSYILSADDINILSSNIPRRGPKTLVLLSMS